ncbi:MAG: CDP-alcohol phosphatidyltransferase family protein [Rhizobiaceae bacterium]|nr:CDP-alcohol phosphatidyltransferase family protein [Rhizobiaceae bacterium]
MATLYDLKPAFQARLRPLVENLAARGITANQVTLAAAALSLATAGLLAAFPLSRPVYLLVPLVLFLRMALNAVDGMLAREHGQASRLGMYLNELCDVVSDTALILAFAAVPGFGVWGVVAFAVCALVSEYAGVLGVAAGVGRNYAGPFGKSDRAFALGLIAVLLSLHFLVDTVAPLVFPALALLSMITVVNRVGAGVRAVS